MREQYLTEIAEQPDALRRAVRRYSTYRHEVERVARSVDTSAVRQIVLTGMGISYHGCYPLWLSLSQLGLPAVLWDTAELVHYAPQVLTPQTILIVVSQSGESAEVKRLMDLPQRAGTVLGITNGEDNSLTRWCDASLSTGAGPETAVSTKTYVTGLALLHLVGVQVLGRDVGAALATLHRVADHVQDFLSSWEPTVAAATDFIGPCEALAFLARGPSMASALAGALMAQEASRIFAAALSSAQFRHGPVEAVREGFRAIMFAGNDGASRLNHEMASYIAACGGKCLVIGPEERADKMDGVMYLPIASVPAPLLPILEIIPVQLLTITLALAKGYEPAAFVNCSKVTTLE
jgi:glucosamine--fructose-6-phosphate aminotransferase (isomerizing)